MHRFKRVNCLRVSFTVYETLKALRIENRPKQRRKGRFLRVSTLRVSSTDGTLKGGTPAHRIEVDMKHLHARLDKLQGPEQVRPIFAVIHVDREGNPRPEPLPEIDGEAMTWDEYERRMAAAPDTVVWCVVHIVNRPGEVLKPATNRDPGGGVTHE